MRNASFARRLALVLVAVVVVVAGLTALAHHGTGPSAKPRAQRGASKDAKDAKDASGEGDGGNDSGEDNDAVIRRPDVAADRRAASRYLLAEVRAKAIDQAPTTPRARLRAGLAGSWVSLGPAPITTSYYAGPNTGRITSVSVTKSGAIFVGTAGGGVWSSTNGGKSWTSRTDAVSTGLAVGAIAVDPSNPNNVYAGTGEDNDCGDCFYGAGVLKSTDGGNTWSTENPGGIFTGAKFSSLVVDPNNSQKLYAGTDVGFYESNDGGVSWAAPTGTYNAGPISRTNGVVVDPATTPSSVYIATEGVGLQKSTDGGVNFSKLGGGLPAAGKFGVTVLAIGTPSAKHPAANQTLYAAIQLNNALDANRGDISVYKTANSGATWVHVTTPAYSTPSWSYDGKVPDRGGDPGDQAEYDNTIAIDPANPAHLLAGGIGLYETTNGGATWSNVNRQTFHGPNDNVVHPDFHALAFNQSGAAYIGCDGGIYVDRASVVSNLNSNLSTVQFYEGIDVFGHGAQVIGGAQDNGTMSVHGGQGWPQVLAGDGGYSKINALLPKQQFAEADQDLFRTPDQWQTATIITPPAADLDLANFVPPLALVTNSKKAAAPTVYYGAGDLWVTRDGGAATPKWTRITRVGQSVSAIAVAPSNSAIVYVGFDDGSIWVTTNATAASPKFVSLASPVSQRVTSIAVQPGTPGSIAATFSSNDTRYVPVAPSVETAAVNLAGTPKATWSDLTANLPTTVASSSVVFDGGALIVATDVGVFLTNAPNGASTVWATVGNGLPNVQVPGLTVDSAGNLYAATHGRGAWKLNLQPTSQRGDIG